MSEPTVEQVEQVEQVEVRFTLDGQEHVLSTDPRAPALGLLRDRLGCTSLKAGCSPQGVCGSCAALVGGKPRLTCTLPSKALDGKEVLTQAGLEPAQAQLIARAFAAAGLAQAGPEVPGMVMALVGARAAAGDAPLDADLVRRALQLHASRNLGWGAVIEALLLADRALRGEVELPEHTPDHLLRAALGERPGVEDLLRPGMLHAAVVFAPHARCRVEGIDTTAALAAPGVVAVLTAAQLHAATTIGACIADQALLVGPGQETRSAADLVAVVAAETADQARAAATLVAVTATALPLGRDVHHAAGQADRLVHRAQAHRGDARAALAACAHQVRLAVETRGSDPLFIEPEAALAVPLADGRFRVYAAGLDLFHDLEQLCAASGLDPDALELVHVPVGGAIGARLDLGTTPHALLLAQATGRPVRLALHLEEGARIHGGRHPTWCRLKLGCDAQGRLQALNGTILLDSGGVAAGGPIVADALARHATLAYDIEHVDLDVLCVRTDGPPSSTSAGLGVPAWTFAVEQALDALAEAAGLDPLELRNRNLLAPGDQTATGLVVPPGWNPGPVIRALEPDVARLRAAGDTVGIAFGVHIQDLPQDLAAAELRVSGSGHVAIFSGFSEHGQGFDTQAMRAAAAATGLPVDVFELVCSTVADVPCGPMLSGRDRRVGVPAVRQAALALRAALDAAGGDLASLAGQAFTAEATADPAIGFSAQAAAIGPDGGLSELVVAVATGGATLDPQALGWLAGAAERGLEWAITAEREVDPNGLPETRWTKLGVLKARVCPTVTVRPVPGGPDLPLEDAVVAATPAAISSALRAATGQAPTVLPAKDNGVARKMGVRPPRPGR